MDVQAEEKMIYIAFEKCENTPASQHEAGVIARDRLFSLFHIIADVKTNENGKPFIDDNSYHFSISHSGTIACCALRCKEENYGLPEDIFTVFENCEGDVGIDIQQVPLPSELERMNRIAARYFGGTYDTTECFARAWTRKEALCKYEGTVLVKALKMDESEHSFFTGTMEINGDKYAISVCY